jgi:hypothetical protein
MTNAATRLPYHHAALGGVSRRSRHTELLLNCARIGYNP